jgi:ribose transport system ATP-binding protein
MADLELNEISKNFGGVVALDQATFHCNTGEVHGLIGQNGAGKTTLVKILSGVVSRDGGDILLEGNTLHFNNPGDAISSNIGMVFQELSLIPDLKVSQNIFIGNELLDRPVGGSRRVQRESCYELFDRMGIDVADPDRSINELTLAQRQMVEIAKIIWRDPKVIVFDEATSALGRHQIEWLVNYCRKLANRGKIIIYISHTLSEIREVADRITIFRNAKDVASFPTGEKTTDEIVNLMLGRQMGRLYPTREAIISDEVAFEANNISVGIRARDISFYIRKGEILGVGGLTGQGQEELFRGLFGIQRMDGEITLNGRSIDINSPRDALEEGIALVPEDRATQGLLLPKSVSDNIALSILPKLLRFGFINRGQEKQVVDSAIDRLSIMAADPTDPAKSLSGGNQQKVVLAKLLSVNPRVLMMYDSTRGVDVGTKAEVYILLRELAATGSAVFWYSTDLDELINMCDRVLVMRVGQIEAELAPGWITEENIVRASVGEPIIKNNQSSP